MQATNGKISREMELRTSNSSEVDSILQKNAFRIPLIIWCGQEEHTMISETVFWPINVLNVYENVGEM